MKPKRKLPEGWRWEELGNLSVIEKEQIDRSNPLFFKLPFIGLENIESNTRRYVSNHDGNDTTEGTCFLFDERHVLYGRLRPYLNKVYLPDAAGRCSTELLPLKPKEGYTRSFLSLVLQSERVINCAVKHSTGIQMPRANMQKLWKLLVPIPSNVQERDALIDQIERGMADVEKMRQATLHQKEAIEALPGAILREAFDFEEEG